MSDPRGYLEVKTDSLRAFAISDVGKEREEDGDAFLIDESEPIVLADGMGGHEIGSSDHLRQMHVSPDH
jgi:serine/threonine protein phosphatase PrpC